MKLIVGGARTGKTVNCLKRCAEKKLCLVVMNVRERSRLKSQFPTLFAQIPKVYTFDEILGKRHFEKTHKGFIFDNIDLMIQSLVNFECVETATVSPQEIEWLSLEENPYISKRVYQPSLLSEEQQQEIETIMNQGANAADAKRRAT